jgi:hypothetical protein
MLDAATAVQDACFTALNVAAVTGLGAEVWAHAPEILPDADPLETGSIVLVHSVSLDPIGGKDGGLDQATATLITLVRKPDPAALYTLQAAVRDQLDGQPVAAFGALLSSPIMVSSEVELLEDGETYMGIQKFETIVQPA